MLGNCFNFENSAYHESTHRYNFATQNGTTGEAEAVILETAHKSWDMVSSQYIYGQAAYVASKLNEYFDGKKEKQAEVLKYVQRLNDVFAGLASFNFDGKKVMVIKCAKLSLQIVGGYGIPAIPTKWAELYGIVGMAGMPYPPTDCRSYIKIILNTYLSNIINEIEIWSEKK